MAIEKDLQERLGELRRRFDWRENPEYTKAQEALASKRAKADRAKDLLSNADAECEKARSSLADVEALVTVGRVDKKKLASAEKRVETAKQRCDRLRGEEMVASEEIGQRARGLESLRAALIAEAVTELELQAKTAADELDVAVERAVNLNLKCEAIERIGISLFHPDDHYASGSYWRRPTISYGAANLTTRAYTAWRKAKDASLKSVIGYRQKEKVVA